MSNEFDYTPPPECGHKVYKTESCAHCIYVVMTAEAKWYIEQRDKAQAKVNAIADEFERTIQYADWRDTGARGMSVPFRGDFASAVQLPSVIHRMRWWVKYFREGL